VSRRPKSNRKARSALIALMDELATAKRCSFLPVLLTPDTAKVVCLRVVHSLFRLMAVSTAV
jgi:hypothetical protein